MGDINFTAYYGDEIKQVRLWYDRWGRRAWYVYIDKICCGYVIYGRDNWEVWRCDELTRDDIDALVEIIEASEFEADE